jgi:hypothetical protein
MKRGWILLVLVLLIVVSGCVSYGEDTYVPEDSGADVGFEAVEEIVEEPQDLTVKIEEPEAKEEILVEEVALAIETPKFIKCNEDIILAIKDGVLDVDDKTISVKQVSTFFAVIDVDGEKLSVDLGEVGIFENNYQILVKQLYSRVQTEESALVFSIVCEEEKVILQSQCGEAIFLSIKDGEQEYDGNIISVSSINTFNATIEVDGESKTLNKGDKTRYNTVSLTLNEVYNRKQVDESTVVFTLDC